MLKEFHHPAGVLGSSLVFDPGVNVFRVLAEDHHIDGFGSLDWRRYPAEVADRANAGVEIELLSQSDVQGPEAAANRGGERALDRDQEMVDRSQRLFREPAVQSILGFLPGKHLQPRDPPPLSVGMLDGLVEDMLRGPPDIGTGTVPLDKGYDGSGRYLDPALVHDDGIAAGRRRERLMSRGWRGHGYLEQAGEVSGQCAQSDGMKDEQQHDSPTSRTGGAIDPFGLRRLRTRIRGDHRAGAAALRTA